MKMSSKDITVVLLFCVIIICVAIYKPLLLFATNTPASFFLERAGELPINILRREKEGIRTPECYRKKGL